MKDIDYVKSEIKSLKEFLDTTENKDTDEYKQKCLKLGIFIDRLQQIDPQYDLKVDRMHLSSCRESK